MGKDTFGIQNEINRNTWIINCIKELPAKTRILDAGAGEMPYKKYCDHLNYVSQDFSQYDGRGDGQGLQMHTWDVSKIDIVSDITQIPQPDASFDTILCSEVFEHIPDPIAAIKEFSRLLKAGGVLLLTAPFCSLTHFAPYHFSTGFNIYFYQKHLVAAGFNIMEIKPNGDYFSYLAQEIKYRIPNQYTTYRLNRFDRLIVKFFNKLLYKMYLKDINSSELLCYGYHVKSVKK